MLNNHNHKAHHFPDHLLIATLSLLLLHQLHPSQLLRLLLDSNRLHISPALIHLVAHSNHLQDKVDIHPLLLKVIHLLRDLPNKDMGKT